MFQIKSLLLACLLLLSVKAVAGADPCKYCRDYRTQPSCDMCYGTEDEGASKPYLVQMVFMENNPSGVNKIIAIFRKSQSYEARVSEYLFWNHRCQNLQEQYPKVLRTVPVVFTNNDHYQYYVGEEFSLQISKHPVTDYRGWFDLKIDPQDSSTQTSGQILRIESKC